MKRKEKIKYSKEKLDQTKQFSKEFYVICKKLSQVCLMLGKLTDREYRQIWFDEQAIEFDELAEEFKILGGKK